MLDEKIFKLLYKSKEPLTAYMIAKKLKMPLSSVRHTLNKMCSKGVIISFKNKKTVYGLHPIFFNKNFWNDYIGKLQEVMRIFIRCQNKKEYKELSETEFDTIYMLQLLIRILTKN